MPYPSLKPLPSPPKPKEKVGKGPPGTIRQSDYERKRLQGAFKKST